MLPTLLFLTLLPVPLTDRLAARNWRTRDAATRAIRLCGVLALPALERGLTHKDAEVRARCAVLLRPYAVLIAERESRRILPEGYPRLPWIATDDWGWYDLYSGYLDEARKLVPHDRHGQPDWPEYREASRLWLRSQLLQRRPRAEIDETLRRWTYGEVAWIREHGREYRPEITIPRHP